MSILFLYLTYRVGGYSIFVEEFAMTEVHHKHRSEEEKKDLLNRLKRIEGQIRGIQKMVDQDLYCPDILVQVSSVTSALNSFNKCLLGTHIKGCVVNDIKHGKDETIDELLSVLQKLMK